MEVVNSFNDELNSLMDCKPPVSKAKMTSVTKAAIKAVKFYKHVVQGVEKFIQKCKSEFKVPGLYVIDSIVRQSRHQFGADKDVFTTRFARNFDITFQNLFKCPQDEKSKIVRVLNLWQKNNVFTAEVIQPLLDMANPNHVIHTQSTTAMSAIGDEQETTTMQQESSGSGWLGWSTDGSTGETDGDLALKAVTQLLQHTKEATMANLLQSGGQQLTQSLAESSLMLQLQQLSNALTQQSTASANYKLAEQEGTVKFNKKLLDFDYSDEDDDDDKKDDDTPHLQQSQENALAVSMAQNLLSNPDLLRQLQEMQQTIQQTEVLKSELGLQEHLAKQRLWQADELATQSLVSGIPPQTSAMAYPASQLVQQPMTLQPPPPFDLGSFPSIMAPHNQLGGGLALGAIGGVGFVGGGGGVVGMSSSLAPPSFLPIPPLAMESPPTVAAIPTMTSESAAESPPIVVVEPPPPAETYTVIDLEDSSLPENDNADNSNDKLDRDVDRKSSPSRRKERSRSRSRSRSKKRSLRRSRSRSPPKRLRRSRSSSRSRNRHKRDRRSRSKEREREREKEREKEKEREREKERKKRGLPPFKKDHLGVCSTTLWLGHVSKLVSEEDLADAFGEFGDIVQIDLIPPRGCAFVLMNRRQDAYRALQKLKNVKMQGKAITMAWAPGKGVKGKIYKDYWDAELGVSYIPYSKIPDDVDLDTLEEGGMIDEETMPEGLREKAKAAAAADGRTGAASTKEFNKQKSEASTNELGELGDSLATEDQMTVIGTTINAQPNVMGGVVPSAMIPPPMMQPPFGMTQMVSGQPMPMMPIGCPPPMMPLMSAVNQQPMMGPVMGGMPPLFTIPTTTTQTPVKTETSQIKIELKSENLDDDSSMVKELLPGSPRVTSSDSTVIAEDVLVKDDPSTASNTTSTTAMDTTISTNSSIPLPPNNVPNVSLTTVANSMTNTMVAPIGTMPPMGMPNMAMPPQFQQFMPPPPAPHMFRPPGFGMMPPMGMNMGQMSHGMGGMNNVQMPPQSLMNVNNHPPSMGAPRISNMPPPPMLPHPVMQGMRAPPPMMPPPPMPTAFNTDQGNGMGRQSGWASNSGGMLGSNLRPKNSDIDMRGSNSNMMSNARPMMNMNPRMRMPHNMNMQMGRQNQQKQDGGGPPSSVSRTSANTEALGTPNLNRQSDVERNTTPIEARLSRIAEMGGLQGASVDQRIPRNLDDRNESPRPGKMLPREGPGLQQSGSIIGRFPGPRMDVTGPRMLRMNMGLPRHEVGFNRFPGINHGVRPPFQSGGPGRFPGQRGPTPPEFLNNDSGDYDMRFGVRPQFGNDRNMFVDRDDRRGFRPPNCDDEMNNGSVGGRFDDNFMSNCYQPPRLTQQPLDGFRDRDERWNNRDRNVDRDFESDRDFRGRFRSDHMRDSRTDDRSGGWTKTSGRSIPPLVRDVTESKRDDVDRDRRSSRDSRDKERSQPTTSTNNKPQGAIKSPTTTSTTTTTTSDSTTTKKMKSDSTEVKDEIWPSNIKEDAISPLKVKENKESPDRSNVNSESATIKCEDDSGDKQNGVKNEIVE